MDRRGRMILREPIARTPYGGLSVGLKFGNIRRDASAQCLSAQYRVLAMSTDASACLRPPQLARLLGLAGWPCAALLQRCCPRPRWPGPAGAAVHRLPAPVLHPRSRCSAPTTGCAVPASIASAHRTRSACSSAPSARTRVHGVLRRRRRRRDRRHCLFRTAGEPCRARGLSRSAAARHHARRRSASPARATRSPPQNVVAGSRSLSVRPPIDATRDWALVRLAAPVCTRPRAAARAPDAGRGSLQRAGRAAPVPGRLSSRLRQLAARLLADRCDVAATSTAPSGTASRRDFIDPDQLILHTCDTGGASSGSPLLIDTAGGPVVVGINVGTYVQSKVMIAERRGGAPLQGRRRRQYRRQRAAVRAGMLAASAGRGASWPRPADARAAGRSQARGSIPARSTALTGQASDGDRGFERASGCR